MDAKLLNLISTLSGVEKREFHHFLDSPFFNRRPELNRLWQFLLDMPKGEEPAFDKLGVFTLLFPGEAYNDARLHYSLTFLREKIEWFLAYRQWDQGPYAPGLALARVYRERKLEKHFRHIALQTEAQLEKMPYGMERRHGIYALEMEKYAFAETMRRSGKNALQDLHQAFDVYALSGKLRLACLMTAHQSVVKVVYDFSFLPLIINWLEKSNLLLQPEIGIYFYCYRALTENSEAHFRTFRRVLELHGLHFDPIELKDILLLAINFCIRQVNAGSQQFVQEAFELYQLGLARGALLEHGVLSRFTYKNITALGLGLDQFDWVKAFIFDNKPLLEERYRESSFCYNLAKLYFAQKNYEAAMPLLAQVDDADFLLMLDARVMLLKMYYETAQWDALDSLLTSFRAFLRRKTSLGYHKTHYISLIEYTQKLLKLTPHDRTARQALRQKMEAAPDLLEKEWLLGVMR